MQIEPDRHIDIAFMALGALIVLVSLLLLTSYTAFGQSEVLGTHTMQLTLNLEYGAEFVAADSADVWAFPAGSIITAVYWYVDSAMTGVDSIQLRLGEIQQIVATYSNFPSEPAPISYHQPMHPVYADDRLRVHLKTGAPPVGQIRLTIQWIQL
jgi:hypothetical protein